MSTQTNIRGTDTCPAVSELANKRRRTEPPQPSIPGTLQDYVHGGHSYDGSGYFMRTSGSANRMTTEDLTAWLKRRKAAPKRCKLCEPALPGAYGSEASDVEAAARA